MRLRAADKRTEEVDDLLHFRSYLIYNKREVRLFDEQN